MTGMRLSGRKLLLRKGTTGTEEEYGGRTFYRLGDLVVTDARADFQHWFEILDVSDRCEHYTKEHVGGWVWLPEYQFNKMFRLSEHDDDWIVHESLFGAEAPLAVLFTEGT